ncbi:MAG: hypothetical protein PVH17_06775 [Anaerolineae bacterium]|jgi:hypothetical protein
MRANRRFPAIALVLFALSLILTCLGLTSTALLQPASPSIVVDSTVLGQTTRYLGATEAGGFWTDDLTDLGINTYRLWTKMAELEWWDDDDALDGQWDDSEYGSPTIAQLKADPSLVPWADWWDVRFDEIQAWRYGEQTRRGIIQALVQNGITPIVVLRVYDDQGNPEMRPGARWAPRPPVDDAFRNEWWEHCFALAYWLNVRNSYGVTHFEVLNEPDWNCQGWCNNSCSGFAADFCGSQAEYVQLVQDAHDAVTFANDMVGLPTYIHAPVVASDSSSYLAYSLQNADDQIQIVDYHTYADDPTTSVSSVQSTIAGNNPDEVTEPIWVSEWGALWATYDTADRALLTARQLMAFSREEVEGVTIFNLYDWSTAGGQDYGLIDLQDDGAGGANRTPTETYYAYRLMTRALKEGKDRLQFTATGVDAADVMVTWDGDSVYIVVINDEAAPLSDIAVDLSALSMDDGTVQVYEYSSAFKDQVVATPAMSGGQFNFTAPASGIALAEVTPSPTAIELVSFTASPSAGYILLEWETASEVDTLGFNLYRSKLPDSDDARLNRSLIPGQSPGSVAGAVYTWRDYAEQPGLTYYYTLEVLDVYGRSTLYGPVRVLGLPHRIYLSPIVR